MSLFKQPFYWTCASVLLTITTSIAPLKGMEESSRKDNLSAQPSALMLTPADLYEWKLLEEKPPEDIIRLALNGKMDKTTGNLGRAIPLLEQAAQYENVGAIVDLADICQSQNKWLQATKWYVLAFQIHWFNTAMHHLKAKEWLKKLPLHHKSIKSHLKDTEQKNFRLFITHLQAKKGNFFSYYPQKKNGESVSSTQNKLISSKGREGFKLFINFEKLCALTDCQKIYTKTNFHEPYLSSREIESKEQWLKRMIISGAYSDEFREVEGDCYYKCNQDLQKALFCFNGIRVIRKSWELSAKVGDGM